MRLSPTVRASLELLGVSTEASSSDLKKAYHKLALVYHPDRNAGEGAAAEFRKITEAYELLCDPKRVAELNSKYLKGKLHSQVIEGLEITFGSFFGYRIFDPMKSEGKQAKLKLTSSKAKNASVDDDEVWLPIEENNSILDHPAFDSLEVVYAGRFSIEDEQKLKGGMKGRELAQLPWVVLNNQGLLRFLDGDLRRARQCYTEICERVPNNIIFTYRLGLCHVLEGFKNPKRTLLGRMKPDMIKVEKGLRLLEHCLKLGTERPVGRQKCLVIRKIIADVYEKTGRASKAKQVWKDVFEEDPTCAEAAYRVKGVAAGRKLAEAKNRAAKAVEKIDKRQRPRLLSD